MIISHGFLRVSLIDLILTVGDIPKIIYHNLQTNECLSYHQHFLYNSKKGMETNMVILDSGRLNKSSRSANSNSESPYFFLFFTLSRGTGYAVQHLAVFTMRLVKLVSL